MLLTLWICALLYNVAEAGSTCFCSATGDPHIRDFSGSTSNVGAGAFTLAKDGNGKFSVDLVVSQTSATLTQIAEVNVKLAGDQPEEMPGYGMIHRADGIEIRVLSNNNVFIIWDASILTGVSQDTLCGGTCPDAEEDVRTQAKILTLEKEYGLQHNDVANLLLDQVKTEIQIDEIIRRLAELKLQGAQIDALIAAIRDVVNSLRRRRRRRSVDPERAKDETKEAVAKLNNQIKDLETAAENATNTVLDLVSDDVSYGLTSIKTTTDGDDVDEEKAPLITEKYVNQLEGEEIFQRNELKGLRERQDAISGNVETALDDTATLARREKAVLDKVKKSGEYSLRKSRKNI